MNSAIITAAASLAIGVGVGWSLKPSSPDKDADKSTSTATGENVGSNVPVRPGTTPLSSKSDRQPSPEPGDTPWNTPQPGEGAGAFGGVFFQEDNPEERRKEQVKREERMRRSHEDQIANLARRLELTPEQQEKLRNTHFAGLLELDRFYNAPGEKPDGPPEVPSLGAVLGDLLTEEQAAAYNDLRTSNMRAAARAEILEKLAELSFLDLSKEQSERFYETMFQKLEAEMAEEDEAGGGAGVGAVGGALIGAVIGNNVSGDRGALIGAALGGVAGYGPGDEVPDPAEAARAEQERVRARQEATASMIATKVAELQEFLTPEQVEEYRHHLEQSYQDGPFQYNPPDLYLPPLDR